MFQSRHSSCHSSHEGKEWRERERKREEKKPPFFPTVGPGVTHEALFWRLLHVGLVCPMGERLVYDGALRSADILAQPLRSSFCFSGPASCYRLFKVGSTKRLASRSLSLSGEPFSVISVVRLLGCSPSPSDLHFFPSPTHHHPFL